MSSYTGYVTVCAVYSVEVEANNEDEAEQALLALSSLELKKIGKLVDISTDYVEITDGPNDVS